jgi:hypothetical protein
VIRLLGVAAILSLGSLPIVGAVAADATQNDLLTYLQSAGVLGLLTLIIYSGKREWWVWGAPVERERQQAVNQLAEQKRIDNEVLQREIALREKAEADRDRLHLVVEDKVIPAVINQTNTSMESIRQMKSFAAEIAKLRGEQS